MSEIQGVMHGTAEQRANAFASELLVPQRAAARALEECVTKDDTARAVARLATRYGASKELVAWQAFNGAGSWPPAVRQGLAAQVSEERRGRILGL